MTSQALDFWPDLQYGAQISFCVIKSKVIDHPHNFHAIVIHTNELIWFCCSTLNIALIDFSYH